MIDAPAAAQRNRRGTAALIFAGLSLILSLIALGVASADDEDALRVQSGPDVASASQVEAVAHVTLPPGTVLLSAVYSNGLETRLSAKFRMPRSELDPFVTASKFTAPLTPGLRAVDKSHDVGQGNLWDPGSATTVAGIDEDLPTADGTRRQVLFDLDTPATVTVYLYAGRH
ncbi:hypothetical protein Ait01nite_016150 [Actinoplanes italicus]|uniref:Uncharacterized protein n=1 Tax=Actinoplanes italicus TaxID=113567 RepID=A0A2T0JZR6_9ACTN|nr:hypothetical protein [Actinoplanes italicus]PRX15772.1 hypothetical protein CLV67_12211 [Actinoplanes italicus]GIE28570.1 hypothetical protein Ait01nite_016150 [Actinoplanes italicus]